MADTNDEQVSTTRRTVLAGVGVVGVAGSLAACGTASSSDGSGGGSSPTAAAAGAAGGVAKATDIPVGSGKIVGSVVVTQPAAGTFKAFGTTCPHQGCQVNSISDGVIKCPCHGSTFSITDGSRQSGPAPTGLSSKTVTVKNGEITIA